MGWIDLESGVPAISPLNVANLFSFYLPKSIYHGHPLFDDIDFNRLNHYLDHNRNSIIDTLNKKRHKTLIESVKELKHHHSYWKSGSRTVKNLQYALSKKRITPKNAAYYLEHPYQWYGNETIRISKNVKRKLVEDLPLSAQAWLSTIDLKQIGKDFWKFVSSQEHRAQLGKNYVERRIQNWKKREKLEDEEARHLDQLIKDDESSTYLADFGFHLGMKLPVAITEWIASPALYLTGLIDETTLGIMWGLSGTITRTAYTSSRILHSVIHEKEKPWVALIVGALPKMWIGDIAYMMQLAYSTKRKRSKLGEFIIYDLFTRIGEKIPIYGGKDTLTEHFFNHLPDVILKNRTSINSELSDG